MKNVSTCEYELSQYHAGQIVTPSARIWCDGEQWHSLVVWHDASDSSERRNHAIHETQAEAEAAINAEVVVMSESWASVDGRKLANLAKLGEKYDLSYRLSVSSNGECVLDGVAVPHGRVIQSIIDQWRLVTIQKFDKEFYDWTTDQAATDKFRAQLACI